MSSTEELFVGMCLWEDCIQERATEPLQRVWENIGTVALRYSVAALVEPCMAEWAALTLEEQEARSPFDWEFVPWFLKERVIWTPTGPVYRGAAN